MQNALPCVAVSCPCRRTSFLVWSGRDWHSVRPRHEWSNEDLSDALDDGCCLQRGSESVVLGPVLYEYLPGSRHIAVLNEIDGEYLIFSIFRVDLSEERLRRVVLDEAG